MDFLRGGAESKDIKYNYANSIIDGLGSFQQEDLASQVLSTALAKELAIIERIADKNINDLKPNFDLSFLKTTAEKLYFTDSILKLSIGGTSHQQIIDGLNEVCGQTFVLDIFTNFPRLFNYDIVINTNVDGVCIATLPDLDFNLFNKYGRVYIFGATNPDYNGSFRITSTSASTKTITFYIPGISSASGDSAFCDIFSTYTEDNPIYSGDNGLTQPYDGQDYKITGGFTIFDYFNNSRFKSTIAKLRIKITSTDSYLIAKCSHFLNFILPSWTDFNFYMYDYFQLAANNNDLNYPYSKLNGLSILT